MQVVNIISGEVGTNILKNDNFRTLPAGEYVLRDLVPFRVQNQFVRLLDDVRLIDTL